MRTLKTKDLDDLDSHVGRDEIADLTRVLGLKRGQASFHHCRTIRDSDVNRAQQRRVSLADHMQDGENRWRRFLNAGTPDYTDPEPFPVIWARG